MRKNYFDALYQYFAKNSKCSKSNHYSIPIYFCSNSSCNKGYICSQCLTEDPEHFSNHVKHFIALDSKKNFFRFLDIPIENIEESYSNNNFILNSRNKFLNLNKDKIFDVNSFYDYIKNQIILTINNNQKNNLIKDENDIGEYYNKKKEIKNKNNEFINNSIKDFIKNDDKHQIINLMSQIKPCLNLKISETNEKDKLNDINNLLSEEIPKIIDKCINILCKMDIGENVDILKGDEAIKENENKVEKNDDIIKIDNIKNEKENENEIINSKNENENNNNKIVNIINDIKPMKNDIKILNIEFNNNNFNNNFKNQNNIFENHKSFYEGSINNISSIKTESNLETEEFESKININMNMNNIEINKQNIDSSPTQNNINKHPIVNDPFFNNKELSLLDKEMEKKVKNKIHFNNYAFQTKEISLRNSRGINYSNNNNIIKENSWANHQPSMQENNPTIAAANNIQIYNNNNNIINDLEIKLNQIHNNKEQNYNNLFNYLKPNSNNDKIIKQSNQFVIDIKKNNHGINPQRNITKSTINISIGNYQKKNSNNNGYLNDSDKLNGKTKENLNRLDKIRDRIGKLLK